MWSASGVDHSWASMELNRLFARKLIKLARQSPNTFSSWEEVDKMRIENFPLVNTGYYPEAVYLF